MSAKMRKEVNRASLKKRRNYTHSEPFRSRILWTTKDIKTRGMGKKGHMEKWSREIYKVLKIITQRNAVKKYKISDGLPRWYFRTEIQKVITVDTEVPASTKPSGPSSSR